MATKVASLYAELGLDQSKFVSGMKSAKGEMVKAQSGLQKFGQAFQSVTGLSLGTAGAIGVAGMAIRKYSQFVGESINAARDMYETQSKTNVIFGKSSQEIERFASTAAKAMGQSKRQAMDAADSFAVFGKAAGLTGTRLVDFSVNLTKLTSDLASFYNTSPEDAIVAIGAALRGETEPIRRYGVLLDDASLRQEALKMGIITTVKQALTPQQRALAAYQTILKQTGDAQGDFARTSEGLANSQRTLQASFEDLKAAFGEAYLPQVAKGTSLTAQYVDELTRSQIAQSRLSKLRKEGLIGYWEEGRIVEKIRWTKEGLADAEDRINRLMGLGIKETGMLANKMEEMVKPAQNLTSALEAETEAQSKFNYRINSGIEAFARIRQPVLDYAKTIKEAEAAQDGINEKFANLNDLIGGRLGPEMEDFERTQADLNKDLAEVRGEYDQLISQGYGPTSEKIGEIQGKIDDLTGKIKENAAAHDEATKRILFDLALQRAELVLNKEDMFSFATNLAEKWGLIDEATANSADAMDQAFLEVARGGGLAELQKNMDRILAADGRVINLSVVTTWSNVGQAGGGGGKGKAYVDPGTGSTFSYQEGTHGWKTVPPGYPNDTFNMRLSSGERYNVVPTSPGPGGQHGLNMIVPPGFPNDTFPIRASSGERVVINPSDNNKDVIKAIRESALDETRLVYLMRDTIRKSF